MGARTGLTCIRHTLCAVNAALWILGCAILTVGIWLRLSYGGYATLLHQYSVLSVDSLCLMTGAITVVVTFFACCGAWFKNKCLLLTYFLLLSLVFILQSVSAIVTFAFRDSLAQDISNELKEGIRSSYNETDDVGIGLTWGNLQTQFQCCGVEGHDDWYDIAAWPGRYWVPISCCIPKTIPDPGCGKSGDEELWFDTGCFAKLRMWFIQRLHVIGCFALVVSFIQLFGLIASMLLFCTMDAKRKSRTYISYQTDT